MPYSTLLVDGATPICTVTLNRPQVLNALDEATLRELLDVFTTLATRKEVRCVIVTGAGDKAFVAGADIAAMATMGPREARAFAELGHRLSAAMEGLHAPVIAAVNGFALGGGLELALCCDFAIASSNAKLGFPEVSLGVIPGFGGTQRLVHRVGLARARELLYTGQLLTAEEAAQIGLVNAVTGPADLGPRVRSIAEKIASRAPLAVADAKRAVNVGLDLPLGRALAYEAELFGALFGTADQREGMRAFLDKRSPKYTGQ